MNSEQAVGRIASLKFPALRMRRPRVGVATLSAVRPELASLLALAAVLDLWSLSRNGWANDYYAATVRSMSSNWHNFFYASFDPSGVMTVDKPPLALWVQALSARLFGFHSLSLLVPQALMGVATVGLTYDLTRRRFGRAAGFAAGLVLALTPMTVAISRHNNPDALLVLCSVGALWCLVRALEDGRARWLLLAGACVGLGFETKMAVALMVVPGIVAAYLWVAPRGRRAAVRSLLAGGAVMTVVGGAWPLFMALTPASSRPWISGTNDNSVLSLILGYNGLGRLTGQSGGPQIAGGGGPGGPGGNAGPFGGSTGPLRLLNDSLGGQAGWLLGFALLAGVAVLASSRLRRSDPRTGWLIAVGGAFVISAVAFSTAEGIFHPYYVSLLAPFTAALAGAGLVVMTRTTPVVRLLAVLAVAAGVATELAVLRQSSGQLTWLPVLVVAVGLAASGVLLVSRRLRVRRGALAAALAVLLIGPAVWSVQTLGHATSATFPSGGPASAGFGGGPGTGGRPGGFGRLGPNAGSPGPLGPPPGFAGRGAPPQGAPPVGTGLPGGGRAPGGGGMFGQNDASVTQAARYVQQHGGGTIAVSAQSGASAQIIASGAHIAGIGGFSGRESSVSVSWLADAVGGGRIRWVLTGGANPGPAGRDGRAGSTHAMNVVAQICREAPVAATGSSAPRASSSGALYDCGGQAAALAAARS